MIYIERKDPDIYPEDRTGTKITLEEVEKACKSLKNRKAAGLDGVSGELMKNGGYWMKVSLCYLFNAALDQRCVPSDWRKGLIVPIFKEGDKEVASNYRGITLLSIVGKLFVTIIEKRLSKWCEDRKILSRNRPASGRVDRLSTTSSPWRR